jgi:uncharacterized membrane protein
MQSTLYASAALVSTSSNQTLNSNWTVSAETLAEYQRQGFRKQLYHSSSSQRSQPVASSRRRARRDY